MMKDKIVIQRDFELQRLKDSKNLSDEEKLYLIDLVSDAADGTNGLDEKDKLQNVSETSFKLATLMSRVVDTTTTLPEMSKCIQQISSKLDSGIDPSEEEHQASWNSTAKKVLTSPWPYICIAVLGFSPYCVDLLKILLTTFDK